MISGKTIQKCIDDLTGISGINIAVAQADGSIVAGTIKDDISPVSVRSFIDSGAVSSSIADKFYFRLEKDGSLVFVVISAGDAEKSRMMGRIALSELSALIEAYSENLDKNSFLQNLLTDNLLMVDIYNRARQLHIKEKAMRTAFVIEPVKHGDGSASETLRVLTSLFAASSEDLITSVDEDQVVLIKELNSGDWRQEISETAGMLVDIMETEAMLGVRVASGGVTEEISQISRSYKEACLTIDVGKLFYMDKNIFSYGSLGIGRLIYQLPVNLCEMFLHEIFGEEIPDSIDEETLSTINTFLDNNLNVSETSRKLYIHRNTLMYRLEKIEKATGLDIREFDDALTLKLAIMVLTYLKMRKK